MTLSKRTFVIEIFNNKIGKTDLILYIKTIYKTGIGYSLLRTTNLDKAKKWKYRKSCENVIENLTNKSDPTISILKKYTYKITEITDNQTLRNIKLKKIKNKNGNI